MTTITVPRAVLKQALEALEQARDTTHSDTLYAQFEVAITALRAALAQEEPALVGWSPEQCRQLLDTALAQEQQEQQEPVAWVDEASIAWLAEHPRGIITTRLVKQKSPERQMAMYAEPPRREWQSLSEEERDAAIRWAVDQEKMHFGRAVARAIEAKLKEKNNG